MVPRDAEAEHEDGCGGADHKLPPELAGLLWEACADRTGPMFTTMTGKRLSDRNLTRVLSAASKRAGVDGVSHHTFRHAHGSILLDGGWTLAEVSHRLGHANPAITAAVYSHRMNDRRRDLSFLDWARRGQGEVRQGPENPATDVTTESVE